LPTLDENLDPEKVQEYMDKHMKEKWFPSGILSFALWGPICPDGCDDTYCSRCFYKSMDELSYGNGSKNKSKDGRGSMRKQHATDEASDRASAPVSDGRGINTNQLLLSGSIAQAQLNTCINLLNKSNDCKYHYLQQMYRDAKEAELELYNRIKPADIDGDWNNPEFRKGKPALEMWYQAMAEVSKCKKDLDVFMMMENKSVEEDLKVLELMELVPLLLFFRTRFSSWLSTVSLHRQRWCQRTTTHPTRRRIEGERGTDDLLLVHISAKASLTFYYPDLVWKLRILWHSSIMTVPEQQQQENVKGG
jgi:hypothetical protein